MLFKWKNVFLPLFIFNLIGFSTITYSATIDYGRLNDTSCTGNGKTAICTAVGYRLVEEQIYPYIVQSRDGGQTYHIMDQTSGLPTNAGTLLSVKCKGQENTNICVAVGYLGENKERAIPLVLLSNVGASNWQVQHIKDFNKGILNKVLCFEEGENSMQCSILGWEPSHNQLNQPKPVIIENKIGFNEWDKLDVSGMPDAGTLKTLTCGASGFTSQHCVAVGYNLTEKRPFVLEREFGRWHGRFIRNNFFDETSFLEDVHCELSYACIAVGHSGKDPAHYTPIVIKGITWERKFYQPPHRWPTAFYAVKVFLNPAHTIIGGSTATHIPFGYGLLVSGDQAIPQSIIQGVSYRNITCTPSNNFCIAVGNKRHPYVVQSMDQGTTWGYKSIANNPEDGFLRASSCTGDGKDAVCLAVGYKFELTDDRGQPLLVQTTNGGYSWEVKEITN